jgi:peptidyl-prolyl cis-trans isomerase D
MMKFLRSQSQTVLVVVLGVIGLGFLFYGNAGNLLTSTGGHVSNDFGRIDGEDLTAAELTDAIRSIRQARILSGQRDELHQPGASAQIAEEAWLQLLLLHEADRLHITVSDQELIDYIHNLPPFQKDGVYSPDVYKSQMGNLRNNLGIQSEDGVDPLVTTENIFENLIRNNLRLDAVRKALFSTVRASAQDVTTEYEKLYGPATANIVTIDPNSYVAAAQVTPAEVEAEYKAHPDNPAYRTQEKRKVDYVLFLLTPDQAKLPEQQKVAAKDALGQKALDFALTFQPEPSADSPATAPKEPDFVDSARKLGLPVATTDFFSADATPAGVPPSPAFNTAAFGLTKDDMISKVIELDNGVAVLHLAEIQPSELRPLDQVKGDITKMLQQAKGQQDAQTAAATLDKALQDAVAKGTNFQAAAANLKLKVETLSDFVPMKAAPNDQRLQTIADVVSSLDVGRVSAPVPVQSDGTVLIIHVDNRGQADPSGLAAFEATFRQRRDQQIQGSVYGDWSIWRSKQSGTHRPPDLDSFGAVE